MGNRIPVLYVSRAMQHLTWLQYWVHHTMCHQVERLVPLFYDIACDTKGFIYIAGDGLGYRPDGYIVVCRTCSHCTDVDSDPYSLFLCRTGIRVRVRLRQCK